MQKRGIFSLVLLLTVFSLFATQDLVDLGTAYELVIAETPLSEAETNTASSVSVITQEQIAAYNAQTTAELVGKAIGTSFNSVGGLGSLQTVVIRGATSSKNLIYLDGVLLSSAHDGTVDLSIIPIDIIERIEIVKSGPGNLGRTNAIGGMVNIITKRGQQSETPFSLSFENGSFLPLTHDTDEHNWQSLVDSQNINVTYTNNGLVATIGGLVAQNAFTYQDGSATRKLRENAEVYEWHGAVNFDTSVSENIQFTTQNLVNYKNLGVPGGLSFGLTKDDYQKDLFTSTTNTLEITNVSELLETIAARLHYGYGQTFYHDDDYQDSTHNKHSASVQVESTWGLGQSYALTTDLLYNLDYVDSTDIGKNNRHTISTSAHGSVYVGDGNFSIHPSVNIAYLSDMETFSPNASIGAILSLTKNTELNASISYAENVPTFSQLYWPFMGNPNLKTEKGLNGEIGVSTTNGTITYEGTLFGRNIYNDIAYDAFWTPQNIAHSFYLGTEQSVELELTENFNIQMSYLFNKSYDLSSGNTFTDDVEVSNVRKHTVKTALFFSRNLFEGSVSAEYLGSTSSLEQAFLVNLNASMQVTDALKAYVAVDNLLNTEYELTSGYPMPGTKIRIGGTVRF
ncbi:TonB-dependent receptor domain-containing protein [uncultured Sphaerochaeta sp.]|uniref:TonB-dependent receptor plug domain-containing protein n=1 Tax=uncultured Sphaerochaeta sp. TaxID=886478 RepID=UPI0029CA2016|nr:TonB-dependent receptor [uncultured Sphaerochaeta sp.]